MPTPRETVVAFLTQACCGTIVALHRMGGMEVMLYKEQLVVMLTRYFNSCWNSLLSGDDPYVVESFNMMKHDNPGCVMRYLFSVGTSVLPDEPPQEIARYSPEDTDDLEAARVTISETLQQLLAERIAVDPFQHSCEGLSLSAERTAWSEKGCPPQNFFEIS
ncbi:uncharacterized protein TEOVI_000200000 [Trypanosoma equiperdum]|uniref:Uncharacterized protein n=4 Tax=Trypanozoon TaxID=39700 RepID=Q38FF8_TRYB2|nr:hypothetical protein, conserved [Trypanosoma brucei gambiense DAL972]XP_803677.1 hypothetical protein, conserved [Trypanosoma brucei brucei TREU927]RHW70528.1 hypothetical protein DPX39_090014300 [Trypanosoma brucei equiperdum]SCU70427.1 hypothetical protein, conserved [Trypanosoma equiperdum]EAN76462.1 hypothetical protein, conserved [Trypanosoma brucei brucei TREU927]CBH14121.1 hypothetical protein, conserved [Trypanosoma brucei gambiense DAL972]|eukprot:XP_011776392.1 hypothetical protein, conserved [Trypanosoma brucei gambiense DAL972]